MKITQRTATLDDAALLLTWRNDPSARDFSQHSQLISSDEHARWFSARLERVQFEPFLFFMANLEVVGMSRLDLISEFDDKYVISILVDPSRYGRGIGKAILDMTCDSFFGLHPNKSILAKVHKQNVVSQRLFASCGFKPVTSTDDFINFEKSFK
jgi:RimJ/RimL family protein N-acetyltransferase